MGTPTPHRPHPTPAVRPSDEMGTPTPWRTARPQGGRTPTCPSRRPGTRPMPSRGNPAEWLEQRAPAQLQEFLDAGFTTVLSAIDPPQINEARKRVRSAR